jgi:hypothetical protein
MTVTATPSSTGIPLGTSVGVGVGVPLGVLALGILGFLIWRQKKQHKWSNMDISLTTPGSSTVWTGTSPSQRQNTGYSNTFSAQSYKGAGEQAQSQGMSLAQLDGSNYYPYGEAHKNGAQRQSQSGPHEMIAP